MGKSKRGMPVVNALILADAVYRDEATKKCVIAGTFNQITFSKFPGAYSGTAMYINLSDFSGTHDLSFRLIRLSDGKKLAESGKQKIGQKDRLAHTEINLGLPPLKFDEPGFHALELLWDDHYLGSCKFNVRQQEQHNG